MWRHVAHARCRITEYHKKQTAVSAQPLAADSIGTVRSCGRTICSRGVPGVGFPRPPGPCSVVGFLPRVNAKARQGVSEEYRSIPKWIIPKNFDPKSLHSGKACRSTGTGFLSSNQDPGRALEKLSGLVEILRRCLSMGALRAIALMAIMLESHPWVRDGHQGRQVAEGSARGIIPLPYHTFPGEQVKPGLAMKSINRGQNGQNQ